MMLMKMQKNQQPKLPVVSGQRPWIRTSRHPQIRSLDDRVDDWLAFEQTSPVLPDEKEGSHPYSQGAQGGVLNVKYDALCLASHTAPPKDEKDGATVQYPSKYKSASVDAETEFDLFDAPPIRFRREPAAYFGMRQANCSSAEVRSLHDTQCWVHEQNFAADQWYERSQYLMGSSGRRAMLPVPEQLLATLASLHREQARCLFLRMNSGGRQVTGLGFDAQ
eukprot:1913829-Amphidinium_carterae.3